MADWDDDESRGSVVATWFRFQIKLIAEDRSKMARKERRWLWHKASLSSINADPETCASSSAQFVTQRGSSERRGGGAISRQQVWKSTCGGSVFSVECQWAQKARTSGGSRCIPLWPCLLLFLRQPPPQVQQGLSMTSVTSMPYTSSRSTRKVRSPCGSRPMALTWSAVRVGSTLPATSDRVWKMRLFSSMKNLRQKHDFHSHIAV